MHRGARVTKPDRGMGASSGTTACARPATSSSRASTTGSGSTCRQAALALSAVRSFAPPRLNFRLHARASFKLLLTDKVCIVEESFPFAFSLVLWASLRQCYKRVLKKVACSPCLLRSTYDGPDKPNKKGLGNGAGMFIEQFTGQIIWKYF